MTDDPKRAVPDDALAKAFRANVPTYKERLWHHVDEAPQAPWFLGQNASVLDIFIPAMTRWTPRHEWFAGACPRLTAIATAADALPESAEVWRLDFPPTGKPLADRVGHRVNAPMRDLGLIAADNVVARFQELVGEVYAVVP